MTRFALCLALAFSLAACGGDDVPADSAPDGALPSLSDGLEPLPPSTPEAPTVSGTTIVDLIAEAPELTTLSGLLQESGLAETLAAEGPFTLFAPSNDAFAGADLEALKADPDALRARLEAHGLAFRLLAIDMDFEQTVESIGGSQLAIVPGGSPQIASGGVRASIVRSDLDAANGVVHVIDAVLPAP